ncbi:purine-nucleoside phosphorylase [Trichloromonas sp.]|uniref:purine-nucleoside phosphorylase n=1 Tax=Trichloromonas sp. TaxID=3069249 RepID=UPI002A416A9E|nr:purine-nucleoside phosphorylase [Trichloromonas sp.]
MAWEEEKGAEILAQRLGGEVFDLAVVLGSGWGVLADQAESAVFVDYREIPGFSHVRVEGHAGRLVAGRFQGWKVLFFQGRYHLYQGFDARQVALPVRLAAALGCRRLLLTNAVGGINPAFQVGDFMYLEDHLNLLGDNPLRGEPLHPFVDLCGLYRQEFYLPLREQLQDKGITLHRGVLAAMPGPSYETPAEIHMLHRLGADVVSMSTVPEAIMGRYLGMEVVALSLIANLAAGLSPTPLSHDEVLRAGSDGARRLLDLGYGLMSLWQES